MTVMTEHQNNGKKYLKICGYSSMACIELIEKIEELNDGETARIICDEKTLVNVFGNYNDKLLHYYPEFYKVKSSPRLGTHNIDINEKMLKRYRKYLNIDTPIILICSSEYGTVGVIDL